jgi:hypothetical protein
MTVMERLVNRAALYSAHFIAHEFRGGINPRGPDVDWDRSKNDWYYTGAFVPYPCNDRELVANFLQPSLDRVVKDLKAALEQHPDEKLTFYGLLPSTLDLYARMFTTGDVRFQAEVDGVVVLACGNYHDGKRRVWVNYLVTPQLARVGNIEIPMDDGKVQA